LAEFNKFFVLY